MRRIIGAVFALVAGVVAADAQGIGYPPGVNPSNPQDMTNRSNPQDLLAPGGYNRQDLVRQPPSVNTPALPRREVTSVPTPRLDTPSPRYTVKSKPKKKKKPYHRGATAQR
jgi:outer membrane biosynthesis protein TonB